MIFIERRQLRGRMEGDGQKLRSLGAEHLPPPSSSEGQGKSNTHWLRSKLVVGKEKSGPYPGRVQILVNSFLSPTPPLPSPTPPHPINHQVQFYVLNITGLPRALTSAQVSTFLPRPSHQSPPWSVGLWSCPLRSIATLDIVSDSRAKFNPSHPLLRTLPCLKLNPSKKFHFPWLLNPGLSIWCPRPLRLWLPPTFPASSHTPSLG